MVQRYFCAYNFATGILSTKPTIAKAKASPTMSCKILVSIGLGARNLKKSVHAMAIGTDVVFLFCSTFMTQI